MSDPCLKENNCLILRAQVRIGTSFEDMLERELAFEAYTPASTSIQGVLKFQNKNNGTTKKNNQIVPNSNHYASTTMKVNKSSNYKLQTMIPNRVLNKILIKIAGTTIGIMAETGSIIIGIINDHCEMDANLPNVQYPCRPIQYKSTQGVFLIGRSWYTIKT